MMTVRELIMELLDFNLDATVSIHTIYNDSESINFSWISGDGGYSVDESKAITSHVFLESDDLEKDFDESVSDV